MPLTVNLRHLEAHDVRLEGEASAKEMDLDTRDEMIQANQPLHYNLEVQKLEGGLLVQGRLQMKFDCECVRCLRPFRYRLDLKEWACHVPLQGDEAVKVINDCVDLTPFIREDILLELPQHPLCDPECRGLPTPTAHQSAVGAGKAKKSPGVTGAETEPGPSAWSVLNKLKL